MQGDLSVNDYCWKMKGLTNSLADLGVDITDRILVRNVLRGLNKNFKHLRATLTHATPFPSFQKVLDDLCLEEIQQGVQGLPPPHCPLRRAEASIILFLYQWVGMPTKTAATPTMPSTTIAAVIRQEEE
jgi:hypothetical protein